MAEMSVFMLLIVPLPYTWKRKLFNFISDSPLVAKLQYGMKVSVLDIAVLRVRKIADGGLDYVHLHLDLVHR